jgi:hypothetical protein
MHILNFLIKVIVQFKSFKFTILLVFLLPSALSYSKNQQGLYDWSAGFRIGSLMAFSIRHYHNQKISFEGIAAYDKQNVKANLIQLSLACHLNHPVKNMKGQNWIIGGGISVSRWILKKGFRGGEYSKNVLGTFAQFGFDYKFQRSPINLSVDWMPGYQFSGIESGLELSGGAVGLRYIF